ncbi:MAG TPA: hypothetical protein VKE74_36370 [Gemmataceae bacterium]|nr:hypothetical protein [Gemmataceae bacterium]
MAFRDFRYPDLLATFGLSYEPAADLFGHVPPSPPSPGFEDRCVTTGTAWKFLQLGGTAVTIDLTEYTLSQVDRLLGILTHRIGPVPQPAAA